VSRPGITAAHTVIDLGAGTGTFAIQACSKSRFCSSVDESLIFFLN
jgi:predicted RNA methylase